METLTPFIEHELEDLPNDTHGRADGKTGVPYRTVENHCAPFRQKNALSFLAGETPGVMASYAPELNIPEEQAELQSLAPTAYPPSHDLAAESDETVQRLLEWREQAPYG